MRLHPLQPQQQRETTDQRQFINDFIEETAEKQIDVSSIIE